jgi:glycerate 2-kinase
LISGGETTVTVKGKGFGGRNMELALSFAMEIKGIEGIMLLSAGTDGTDGPTDAAGAIVDGNTTAKAKAIDINPEEYLRNNDSYNFFKKTGELFITGPTGTNVMDIQIIIVEQ